MKWAATAVHTPAVHAITRSPTTGLLMAWVRAGDEHGKVSGSAHVHRLRSFGPPKTDGAWRLVTAHDGPLLVALCFPFIN